MRITFDVATVDRSSGGITDGADDKRMTADCKGRDEALAEM
jgi:hypothetical protein